MKYILSLIISGALVVSGFGQTRNVLVGTNNAVVQPTNFWSADAANARTGLGLGTAATNPATAFQPSSLSLSNLSTNNGGELTNLNTTNIVGTLSVAQGGTGSTNASDARLALGLGTASTNPASAFQFSSATLSNLATANGGSLTNLQSASLVGLIPSSNIPSFTFTNLSGTLSVAQGGTGATNAANARQNFGSTTVGDAVFTATNAEAARIALSLGTAATSAVTAFQPANANLTNLSTNNGASLTGIPIAGIVNLQSNLDTKLSINGNGSGLTGLTAANITGTVALASNITGTAPLATNVTGTVAIANGGTGATTASGARTALGASTVGGNLFTLVNPSAIRFLRLNADNTATALSASDFRTAIGLSTAATNAEFAFQPASTNLTTLAGNNGVNLTNIPLAGVVGALATNGSASGLTNFPASLLTTNGNGSGLTSLTAANINGIVGLASNVSGVVAIVNGGTGSTNASNARTALGLGTAATNNVGAFVASSSVMTNLSSSNAVNLTNLQATNIVGQIPASNISSVDLSNVSGVLAISSGGTGATNAETARTNLGLGWSALTNANAATALLGYNASNNVVVFAPTNTNAPLTMTNNLFFESGKFLRFSNATTGPYIGVLSGPNILTINNGSTSIDVRTNDVNFYGPINFGVNVGFVWQGQTRTNLSLPLPALTNTNNVNFRTDIELGWSALTNTNSAGFQAALFGSNTNPVLVNTNGEVVSPTNFWQVAPIVTRFVEFDPPTNATTNIVAARNLHIHSMAISRTGVTSTITLPTNGATFDGDIALVVHKGPTSSMTKVRTAGSTNDLVTMTRFDDAVEFVYYDNVWQFSHNLSFVEPIYFSGTNAAANAAASRTNLGLGATNDVTFGSVVANGAEVSSFAEVNIGNLNAAESLFGLTNTTTINESGISFSTNTIAAATRTNLGLGATNNVTFSNVTASGTLTATGTVTATTNLVVNGFVDFSTNHTNSNPATNNQIQKFLQIRIGTNAFFLPLYQ